jgi:hypothetical protein
VAAGPHASALPLEREQTASLVNADAAGVRKQPCIALPERESFAKAIRERAQRVPRAGFCTKLVGD